MGTRQVERRTRCILALGREYGYRSAQHVGRGEGGKGGDGGAPP